MGSSEVNGPLWGAQASTWAELQEATARPLYEHAFVTVKLGAGTDYLDAGCGSGAACVLAAARGAKVSGFDASEALLEIARRRLPSGDFRLADLEKLPFADHSFAVVTGFNAFQYATQPAAGLREAARVTRPGGHVIVATWAPAEKTQASQVIAAMKPLMPPPPPGAGGPFALSDEAALRALAESAGLKPVAIHDVESPFSYPDTGTAVRALGSSGVAARVVGHAGRAAVDAAHLAVVERFVRPDGSVFIPNTFRYLLATR